MQQNMPQPDWTAPEGLSLRMASMQTSKSSQLPSSHAELLLIQVCACRKMWCSLTGLLTRVSPCA